MPDERFCPISPVSLGAHMVYGLIVFLFSALVIAGFGWLFFDLNRPVYSGSVVLALIIPIFALFPFGMFVTSLARNNRAAAAISSLLLNLMLFLSGATFPLEMMPVFLQHVAKLLPLYYVVDLLRQTWNSTPITDQMLSVFVLIGIGVVSSVLAAKFFRWSN
ncbi:ABC-type polysaccharide/polyol phosphate export permease [Caldalkalibacillus uzonensis]|uniref:Transport permease protein n=1 Tax=Caldalkalibacillus uzonensis TaxID=353224 RepID=A0ABU0CQR8_9BACI|nr:ABC transporter permease [Caldalkalibacillus uzonensis]MDQ0338433.1 ABC-type polysaccharide/polyol phosphate export permease [Caldalkalibacillus uzonensis]